MFYTWFYSYNNDKFEILAPTWNEEFELPDGSYSMSDIQYYFEKTWRIDYYSFNKNICK